MAITYELKENQTDKNSIDDVEIIKSTEETKTFSAEETICLRKLKAAIESIDASILNLSAQKAALESEIVTVTIEAKKYDI